MLAEIPERPAVSTRSFEHSCPLIHFSRQQLCSVRHLQPRQTTLLQRVERGDHLTQPVEGRSVRNTPTSHPSNRIVCIKYDLGVSIMSRLLSSLAWIIVVWVPFQAASADQFVTRHHGREIVVHTNPIPVLLHRAVPPNLGKHVTVREYRAGKIPPQSTSLLQGNLSFSRNSNRPRP